ncbi:hypothetical protein UlMin_043738 [Ulmus minor]
MISQSNPKQPTFERIMVGIQCHVDVLFRSQNIIQINLQVKSTPPAQPEENFYTDPAVIKSHTGVPASSLSVASVSKSNFTEPNQWLDTLALTSRSYLTSSVRTSSCDSKRNVFVWYNGMSNSNLQQHVAVQPPSTMLNPLTIPHSVPYSTASNLGPMLSPSPSLLASDQLLLFGPHILYPNQHDTGALTPISSDRSSLVPVPIAQPPLLMLPNSSQKTVQLTEEFDFIAMNEKFKKDKVWDYLGKAKQIDNAQKLEDKGAGHNLENKEGHGSTPTYKKDEFFDTISCNSFNHRPNPGYGGYGVGCGENFEGPYRGKGIRLWWDGTWKKCSFLLAICILIGSGAFAKVIDLLHVDNYP